MTCCHVSVVLNDFFSDRFRKISSCCTQPKTTICNATYCMLSGQPNDGLQMFDVLFNCTSLGR